MIFTTEDGRKFNVGIAHTSTRIPRYPGRDVRCTKMWLQGMRRCGIPVNIVVQAVCSPDDNYCRKTGREKVRREFLKELNKPTDWIEVENGSYLVGPVIKEFTREDRKKLFTAVYPEYHVRRRNKNSKTPGYKFPASQSSQGKTVFKLTRDNVYIDNLLELLGLIESVMGQTTHKDELKRKVTV